jgi:hypothetical protein
MHYLKNIAGAKARPGVIDLIEEILAVKSGTSSLPLWIGFDNELVDKHFQLGKVKKPYDIKVGICSASSREGFEKLTEIVVGPER